MCIDIYPDRV